MYVCMYVCMYICIYVCMYVYVRTSGVACVRAFVHVCMYVRMTYIRVYLGFMCLACVGPAMRATCTYIHTYDVATHCATVGTTPSLLGCDESSHMHICAYVLLGFTCLACAGLAMRATQAYNVHTHKRCCCTLCYCSMTPSLLVRSDTVCTKLLALQTDSSARGTPCAMCTPSNLIHVPLLHSLGTAITTSCSFAFGTTHPCSLKYIHTLHSYDYVHGMYKPSLLSEMQSSRAQDNHHIFHILAGLLYMLSVKYKALC